MMKWMMVIITVFVLLTVCYIAGAEESEKYILCDPKPTNRVAIRSKPKKGAEETGRLECGDRIITDGKIKNGYLHILGVTEAGEGWVHKGYVVDDPPVIEECYATVAATGRVRTYNRVCGKKSGWVNVCTDIRVYARSEEWAVTSKGYIKTKYLEVWYGN